MRKLFFMGILLLLVFSCRMLPQDVEVSLKLAGSNKKELKKVLQHYKEREQDSLKFRAACFLIGNMKWHYSSKKIKSIDPRLREFCLQIDSVYYEIWQEKRNEPAFYKECKTELRRKYKWLKDSIRNYHYRKSDVENSVVCDLLNLDSKFLIEHIDNAFYQWQRSPFTRRLGFEEFCEAILPYRAIRGYPFLYSGETFNQWFGKYVNFDTTEDLARRVVRYNRRVMEMRHFLGSKPMDDIGIYNLFFHGHDCADIAAYGCSVMRSCGIPVRIEFCEVFRDFNGRHYYCIAPDSNGVWQTFNPESSFPGTGKWVFNTPMNLYRQCYGAQKDSPYFLRNKEEYLPPLFSTPCIQEITAERVRVYGVTLPFREKTDNHLAYLAAFQNKRDLTPVTWGQIDPIQREVHFANVMPDRLYFPVYYEGNELCYFGQPFYIKPDSLSPQGFKMYDFQTDTTNKQSVILTRKFPRKPNMVKLANELVGSTFCGANRSDFSDAKVLYTITEPPGPWLQDYVIPFPRAYRYYRFKAPDKYPHAHVSWLEFLTSRKYGYSNVLSATPAAILQPADTAGESDVNHWMKLWDTCTWDRMKWKAEFDGNMQTAPSPYQTVFLRLEKPQVVERFRFAPKNADNGIKRGNDYELFYWNKGWHSCGAQTACFEYLEFSGVPEGALCWLRNYSGGKEELPFVCSEGRQLFLYYDILK